jgi:hypothetical protein
MEEFDAIEGEWAVEIKPYEHAPEGTSGEMTLEWLRDERVMVQRSVVENPIFPQSVSIIIDDDSAEGLALHYFDSRGVSRFCRTRIREGVWKIWREAAGPDDFSQRFEGRISEDGKTIEGSWSKTGEGGSWEHDFDLTYTRVG